MPGKASVEFDHIRVSRHLVKAVHILGDDGFQNTEGFQPSEPLMGRVRSCMIHHIFKPFQQDFPYLFRIIVEGIDMGIGRIDLFPHTAFASEWRDSAFNRDTGSGQGHCKFRFGQVQCRLSRKRFVNRHSIKAISLLTAKHLSVSSFSAIRRSQSSTIISISGSNRS